MMIAEYSVFDRSLVDNVCILKLYENPLFIDSDFCVIRDELLDGLMFVYFTSPKRYP